jgi:hypothetical protein
MRGLVAAALALGAVVTGCAAHADPPPLVADSTSVNHSVNISTINGVTKVVVDGVELHGAEAQKYIDGARQKAKRKEGGTP